MKQLLVPLSLVLASACVFAKLPALADDAKAKAAEAAAKSAWSAKVDNYLLCKSQDKVAGSYYLSVKAAGKEAKPAVPTPPCADAGAFVYPPPDAAMPPAPAGAAAAPGTAASLSSAKQPNAAASPAKKP